MDWLAERKRRFKALETTSLNPLPEMAQRVADLRATAARLVGRLQLIFEAASEDRRTINRAVLLEELQAIMPAVCAEFKDRLQGTELLAAFQALDPNLGDNVSWPTVSKWWKQVVATWEKQAVPAFSKPLVAITPLSPTSSSLRPARRMPVPPPAAQPPRAATPRKSTAATAADVPKSHAELLSEITMAEWPRPHAKHAARSAEAQASERAAVLYRYVDMCGVPAMGRGCNRKAWCGHAFHNPTMGVQCSKTSRRLGCCCLWRSVILTVMGGVLVAGAWLLQQAAGGNGCKRRGGSLASPWVRDRVVHDEQAARSHAAPKVCGGAVAT